MAPSTSRPRLGGLWDASEPQGSRNQNADPDTDDEHRFLREGGKRENSADSEDGHRQKPSRHRGSRNQNADPDTDDEHREIRGRVKKEDSPTSEDHPLSNIKTFDPKLEPEDDVKSHIPVVDLPRSRGMNFDTKPDMNAAPNRSYLTSRHPIDSTETSSTMYDSDETISDPDQREEEEEDEQEEEIVIKRARNGYKHNVDDFTKFYKELHLRSEFYQKFHSLIQDLHKDEDVKAAMMSGTNQGVQDVAAEFLHQYGPGIWKLKGKNSQQDQKKYRDTLFDIKKDPDRLIPILEKLWFKVRDLLYIEDLPASPIPALPVGQWTQYGNRDNPNLREGPLPADIPSMASEPEEWEDSAEDKADMARFMAKVLADRTKRKV